MNTDVDVTWKEDFRSVYEDTTSSMRSGDCYENGRNSRPSEMGFEPTAFCLQSVLTTAHSVREVNR
jgi:hypothetical protein